VGHEIGGVHQQALRVDRIVTADEDAELLNSLADNTYDAAVERAVVVGVEAYDWNCQQHITPRFTVEELQPALASTTNKLSPHRPPTGA
jgi:predicted pyridoxine 5'-phosphate oxidase superfamily flavin-nucleotide-binding protein